VDKKENTRGVNSVIEQAQTDLNSLLLNFEETSGEGEPAPEKLAEMLCKAPEPVVAGSEQVDILSHDFLIKEGGEKVGVLINIKNIASADLGKVVFESVFFDIEGNVVDMVEYQTRECKNGENRTICIETPKAKDIGIRSYDVRIKNVVITPIPMASGNDRISIIKHTFQELDLVLSNADGEVRSRVSISLMNVSEDIINTAIFEAEFYDLYGESLGTVHHEEYDIKPKTRRAFFITTDSIEEYKAKSYKIRTIDTITTKT
jgi:hypothetical protein